MSAKLVHDLNNLVTTISMSTEYLQMKLEDNRDASRFLKNIQGASATMQALAENFATFGRRNAAIERFPVGLALTKVRDLARHGLEAGWELNLQMGTGVEGVHLIGSMADLQSALLNLILNARDALAGDGREGGVISVFAECQGGWVQVAVDDDGPGVPSELRLRIFEPFYTTKGNAHGTGLGLASVWKMVESMEGSVVCTASPLGGARFVLRLPVARERAD
jgi:signal transduction histidine kinase